MEKVLIRETKRHLQNLSKRKKQKQIYEKGRQKKIIKLEFFSNQYKTLIG